MTMRVLLLALLLDAQVAVAQNTFHGNNARTGVYDSAGPKQFGGIKWTFKTGGPIVASPAIADGVVYIPSMDTYLYAIDQESGKEKWKYKSSMPIASSPAIAGGLLYFVSSAGALGAIDITHIRLRHKQSRMHGTFSPRPPQSQTAKFISEAAMATSMPPTRTPASCNGSSQPKIWCTPHPRPLAILSI